MRIEYAASASTHALHLRQRGSRVEGTHQGDFVSRDSPARSTANTRADRAATYTERHGDALNFRFTGTVAGDEMAGTLDMGEYLKARWTAKRHATRG